MPSFDVVSKVDMQEVDNACNQAKKEVTTRYDLKDTCADVELGEEKITLKAANDMQLKAVKEILSQKLVKRGLSLKSVDFAEPEKAGGDSLRQVGEILQGIKQDEAKRLVKLIKDQKYKKIQSQIQGDQLRVTGKSRDDLQEVIAFLKDKSEQELQFVNFRD